MTLDPRSHAECLQFIRAAIATNDPQTARDVASALADCCQRGHANRAAIWADLSEVERQQFRSLVKWERPEVCT